MLFQETYIYRLKYASEKDCEMFLVITVNKGLKY